MYIFTSIIMYANELILHSDKKTSFQFFFIFELPRLLYTIFILITSRVAATHDWGKPISLKEVIEPEVLANHKQVSEYVFLDSKGLVNYNAAVSKEAVDQVGKCTQCVTAVLVLGLVLVRQHLKECGFGVANSLRYFMFV